MPRKSPAPAASRYAVRIQRATQDSLMLALVSAGNVAALFTLMTEGRTTPPSYGSDVRATAQRVSVLYACERAARYLSHAAGSATPAAIESLFATGMNGIPSQQMIIPIPDTFTPPKG